MTKEEFIKDIERTYATGVGIIKIKNEDYANSTNPFRNFESASIVGIGVERAILLRVLDKLSRIGNLIDKRPSVVSETMDDTIVDGINYLAILKAYRSMPRPERSESQ